MPRGIGTKDGGGTVNLDDFILGGSKVVCKCPNGGADLFEGTTAFETGDDGFFEALLLFRWKAVCPLNATSNGCLYPGQDRPVRTQALQCGRVSSHWSSQPWKSLYTDVGAYFDTPLTAVLAPGARFSSIDHGLLVLFSHGNDSSGGD